MTRRAHPIPRLDPDIAHLAGATADPSRIAMLTRCSMATRFRSAPSPAAPGISAAAASGHLRLLVDQQLVVVDPTGRCPRPAGKAGRAPTPISLRSSATAGATASGSPKIRGGHEVLRRRRAKGRKRISVPSVAQLLESIAAHAAPSGAPGTPGAAPGAPPATAAATAARELRFARTCYDHLAGVVGVGVTRALLDRHWLQTPATARDCGCRAPAAAVPRLANLLTRLDRVRLGSATAHVGAARWNRTR